MTLTGNQLKFIILIIVLRSTSSHIKIIKKVFIFIYLMPKLHNGEMTLPGNQLKFIILVIIS